MLWNMYNFAIYFHLLKLIIFSIFGLFIAVSCTSLQFLGGTRQDFSIEKHNINGRVYHILFKTRIDSGTINLDSLCISHNIVTDFSFSVLGKSNKYTAYLKGDTILISFTLNENKFYHKSKVNDCIFISCRKSNHKISIQNLKILNPTVNN
jgi:hypothetical protein